MPEATIPEEGQWVGSSSTTRPSARMHNRIAEVWVDGPVEFYPHQNSDFSPQWVRTSRSVSAIPCSSEIRRSCPTVNLSKYTTKAWKKLNESRQSECISSPQNAVDIGCDNLLVHKQSGVSASCLKDTPVTERTPKTPQLSSDRNNVENVVQNVAQLLPCISLDNSVLYEKLVIISQSAVIPADTIMNNSTNVNVTHSKESKLDEDLFLDNVDGLSKCHTPSRSCNPAVKYTDAVVGGWKIDLKSVYEARLEVELERMDTGSMQNLYVSSDDESMAVWACRSPCRVTALRTSGSGLCAIPSKVIDQNSEAVNDERVMFDFSVDLPITNICVPLQNCDHQVGSTSALSPYPNSCSSTPLASLSFKTTPSNVGQRNQVPAKPQLPKKLYSSRASSTDDSKAVPILLSAVRQKLENFRSVPSSPVERCRGQGNTMFGTSCSTPRAYNESLQRFGQTSSGKGMMVSSKYERTEDTKVVQRHPKSTSKGNGILNKKVNDSLQRRFSLNAMPESEPDTVQTMRKNLTTSFLGTAYDEEERRRLELAAGIKALISPYHKVTQPSPMVRKGSSGHGSSASNQTPCKTSSEREGSSGYESVIRGNSEITEDSFNQDSGSKHSGEAGRIKMFRKKGRARSASSTLFSNSFVFL